MDKKILKDFKQDHPEYLIENAEELIEEGTIEVGDIGGLFEIDVAGLLNKKSIRAVNREMRERMVERERKKENEENEK